MLLFYANENHARYPLNFYCLVFFLFLFFFVPRKNLESYHVKRFNIVLRRRQLLMYILAVKIANPSVRDKKEDRLIVIIFQPSVYLINRN